MKAVAFIPDNSEVVTNCECCDRPMYSAGGEINIDGEEVAGYWYRWSDGHEGRFVYAIAWEQSAVNYVATAWCQATADGINHGLNEIEDSPWGDMSEYGLHLGREALLKLPDLALFWKYSDLLTSREPILSSRIKAYYGLA